MIIHSLLVIASLQLMKKKMMMNPAVIPSKSHDDVAMKYNQQGSYSELELLPWVGDDGE